jgi:hypothetical protein
MPVLLLMKGISKLISLVPEAIPEAPFAPLSANPVYTPSLQCVQLMEQLVHEFTLRSPGYTLICKALILHILAILLRTQIEQN